MARRRARWAALLLRSYFCSLPFVDGACSATPRLLQHFTCEGKPSLIDQIDCSLHHLYGGDRAGFDEEDKARELTYGEVTALGVQQFIDAVPEGLESDDVFFDLGSGVGKSVLQVYLTTAVNRASGVELAQSRHQHGMGALAILRSVAPAEAITASDTESQLVLDGRELSLTHGDVLTADISGGTVFFVSSLAFPDFVLRGVQERIVSQMPPGTVAAFSQKIRGCHRGLAFLRPLHITMTWQKNSPMFLYIVTPPEGGAALLAAQGSAAISSAQWAMGTTQAARLRALFDAKPERFALHRSQGEEKSEAMCDAVDLEARWREGRDEVEKLLQSIDIGRIDGKGLSVFQHICDMHMLSVRSVAKFSEEHMGGGVSFAAHQEKKQKVLEGLVQALLRHRSDPSSANAVGRTALQEADNDGDEVLAALLRAGAAEISKGEEL